MKVIFACSTKLKSGLGALLFLMIVFIQLPINKIFIPFNVSLVSYFLRPRVKTELLEVFRNENRLA